MLYDKEYVKDFQTAWPLEELKSMTLRQYSNGQTKNPDNFLYWVVFKKWRIDKDNMKETLGIYKHIRRYDDSYYDWDRSIYNTEEEAFEKIKNEIIKVAQYSQKGKLDEIDNLKLLHFQFKWRIAFLYQNLDDTKMFDIFSEISQRIINGEEPEKELLNLNLQKMTKGDNMKTAQPLNQILYGPPGTGKTYNTINKALKILGEQTEGKSRAEIKAKFDEYRQNGQIEFVTFHQNFLYEEFVEGIKPNTDNPENMIYEPKDGIFKRMRDRALYKEYQFKSGKSEIQTDTKTRVWKISIVAKNEAKLRKEVLDYCFKNNEVRIGWSNNKTLEQISVLGRNDQSSIYQFENEADIGDIVCVFENANGDIKGIGIIESKFYWDDADNSEALKLYPRARKIKWLSKEQINIRDLNGGTNLTQKTFYPLDRVNAIELLNRIGKLDKKDLVVDNTQKHFVLVIDEINRGNISKILGELITLIEPSKRIGASDEEKARGIGNESLEVTLPYSNDKFGVPSNLYIIGTMNTADRSIALLDMALRRRFEFVEMMPNPKLLKDNKVENTGINLQTLLEKINERIEFLLDREHTIGHSFFIGVDSLDKLREMFRLKIIPLLQEYFYDDYAKIDAVLGGNGMVEIIEVKVVKLFHKDADLDLEDKKIYKIKPFDDKIWDNPQTYINIYDDKVADSQDTNEADENE